MLGFISCFLSVSALLLTVGAAPISFLGATIGIVGGVVSLLNIRTVGLKSPGRGMASAAIAIGAITLPLSLLVMLSTHAAGTKGVLGGSSLEMTTMDNSESGVVLGGCLLNPVGSQVTASGTFTSPISDPANIGGPTPKRASVGHEMNLVVVSSSGIQLGRGSVNVPNGSKTWNVTANKQKLGVAPAKCVLQLAETH